MPIPSAFVDGVLGRLLLLGPVRARARFGGWAAPLAAPGGAGALLPWAELGLEAARRQKGRRMKARHQKRRVR